MQPQPTTITPYDFVNRNFAELVADGKCRVSFDYEPEGWIEVVTKANMYSGYFVDGFDGMGGTAKIYIENDEKLMVSWLTPSPATAPTEAATGAGERPTTINPAKFIADGYGEKIMRGECVVIEEQVYDIYPFDNDVHEAELASRERFYGTREMYFGDTDYTTHEYKPSANFTVFWRDADVATLQADNARLAAELTAARERNQHLETVYNYAVSMDAQTDMLEALLSENVEAWADLSFALDQLRDADKSEAQS